MLKFICNINYRSGKEGENESGRRKMGLNEEKSAYSNVDRM